MADFMIKADIDLTAVEQKLKAFQTELNAIQAAGKGSGVKVPVLPPATLEKIGSPGLGPGADKAAIDAAIKGQAELIALKLKELEINQKLLGQPVNTVGSKKELQAAAREGLKTDLGRDLTTTETKKLNDQVNRLFANLGKEVAAIAAEANTLGGEITAKMEAEALKVVTTPGAQIPINPGTPLGPTKEGKFGGVFQQQNIPGETRVKSVDTQISAAERDATKAARAEQKQAIEQAAAAAAQEAENAAQGAGVQEIINEIFGRIAQSLNAFSELSAAAVGMEEAELSAYRSAMGGLVEQIILRSEEMAAQRTIGDAALVSGSAALRGQASQLVNQMPALREQLAGGQAESMSGLQVQRAEKLKALEADPQLEANYIKATAEITLRRIELANLAKDILFVDGAYGKEMAHAVEATARLATQRDQAILASPTAVPTLAGAKIASSQKGAAVAAEVASPTNIDAAAEAARLTQDSLAKLAAAADRLAAASEQAIAPTVEAIKANELKIAKAREELAIDDEFIAIRNRRIAVEASIASQTTQSIDALVLQTRARIEGLQKNGGDQTALAQAESELAILQKERAVLVKQLNLGNEDALKATIDDATVTAELAVQKNNEIAANQVALDALAGRALSDKELSAALLETITSLPGLVKAFNDTTVTIQEQNNLIKASLLAQEGYIAATGEAEILRLQEAAATRRSILATEEGRAAILADASSKRLVRQAGAPTGVVGGFKATEGGDAGAFFGRGLATTLKFAVPSLLLFGSFGKIKDAIKDSEDLNITFTKLQSQLSSLGPEGEQRFKDIRAQVVGLSKDSGIAAADLGDIALQLQGAFGDLKFNKFDPTGSLGGLKGSDNIIRYGNDAVDKQLEAANKLSLVTGIAKQELVDGLTAASIAFGASADRIGDVATKLEEKSGVKAKEIISFLGDIGPSATEAGGSLEQFAAIAAQVQKRSGQSGSTIAEQLNRIFASLNKNSSGFFEIADKNKNVFGDQYNALIKSIQGGDTIGVFNILAGKFNQLDKASKTYIVDLIGGQRQANTLLAAFGDSSGLKKLTAEANNSAGSLDKRYAALQQRISTILGQLKAGFNQLVKTFVDGGFGQAVGLALLELKTMLQVVNAFLGPFNKINSLTHGWLGNLLGVAIQLKIITALMAVNAASQERAAKNALAEGVAYKGSALFQAKTAVIGFGQNILHPGEALGGTAFGQAYRNSLIQSNIGNVTGSPYAGLAGSEFATKQASAILESQSNATLRAGAGSLASLKAAGSGLRGALNTASGGFLAATAIFAEYQFFANAVEKDANKVKELRAEISKSKKSASELKREADRLAASGGAESQWEKGIKTLTGTSSKEDLLRIEAIKREFANRKNANTKDALQVEQLAPDGTFSKLLFGNDERRKKIQKVYSDIQGAWSSYEDATKEARQKSGSDFRKFDNELKKILGLSNNEAIPIEIEKVIADSKNDDQLLKALRKIDPGNDPKLQASIEAMIAELSRRAQGKAEIRSYYQDIRDPINRLKVATSDKIGQTLQNLTAAYDSGEILYGPYTTALKRKIAELRGKPSKSEEENKALNDAEKALAQATRDRIKALQETSKTLLTASGASDTVLVQAEIADALSNLNNPAFNNPKDQHDLVMTLVEKQRQLYLDLIKNAKTVAEVDAIIKQGFQLPPEISAALKKDQIQNDETYQNLAYYVQQFRSSQSANMKILMASLKIDPTKGPGALLDEFLAQQAKGFDPAYIKRLQTQYQGLASKLSNPKDLTPEEIDQIKGTMKFIGDMLQLAGQLPDITPTILGAATSAAIAAKAAAIKSGKTGDAAQKAYDDAFVATLSGWENSSGSLLTPEQRVVIATAEATAVARATSVGRTADTAERAYNDAYAAAMARMGADQSGNPLDKSGQPPSGPDYTAENERIANFQKSRDRLQKYIIAGLKKNDLAIAEAELQLAKQQLADAQSLSDSNPEKDDKIAEAIANQAAAQAKIDASTKARNDSIRALNKARLVANGDTVAAAQADLAQSQADLQDAIANQDIPGANNARAAIIANQKAVQDAQTQIRDAQAALLKAQLTKDDPVAQAQFDLNLARIQLGEARGVAAKAQAALRVLESERALRDKMAEARMSIFALREAQMRSMDDEVGAAQVSAAAARQQLADAVARGAGAAELNSLQVGVINADKSARDTLFQNQMDDYKYLLDMGKITKGQYADYLKGLLSTLQPGTKQFKDLEVTIRGLTNDIGNDLQANLPTSLKLPTLYEVRRLNQTAQSGTTQGGIGYQDNRNVNVNVVINKDMSTQQVLDTLNQAMGTGRNGTYTSRY